MSAPRFWFTPAPGYDGPRIELTCGRHTKSGRFIPKNVKLTSGITRLSKTRRTRIRMAGGPSTDVREIYAMHAAALVSDTIAALDGRNESGLSGKEANEQRDNLEQAVWLLQTTPSLPANSNRARALRRLYDTIAALDLAGRSESGLSGIEADEQRDNLVQVVRLLRFEAR